jgi:hypothetical protein
VSIDGIDRTVANTPLSDYLQPKYALVPFDVDACSIKGATLQTTPEFMRTWEWFVFLRDLWLDILALTKLNYNACSLVILSL